MKDSIAQLEKTILILKKNGAKKGMTEKEYCDYIAKEKPHTSLRFQNGELTEVHK